MKVEELPSNLVNDAQSVVQGFHSKSDYTKEFDHLWAWLIEDGYNLLTDLYDDWIVADLKRISKYHFSDSEMLDHINSTIQEDLTTIHDSNRIEFARSFLTIDDSADDSLYPSPVAIDLFAKDQNIIIGILLHPRGQAGFEPEFFGLFNDKEEFENKLRSHRYIRVTSIESVSSITDIELIELWNK